jgi:hypothetical protein
VVHHGLAVPTTKGFTHAVSPEEQEGHSQAHHESGPEKLTPNALGPARSRHEACLPRKQQSGALHRRKLLNRKKQERREEPVSTPPICWQRSGDFEAGSPLTRPTTSFPTRVGFKWRASQFHWPMSFERRGCLSQFRQVSKWSPVQSPAGAAGSLDGVSDVHRCSLGAGRSPSCRSPKCQLRWPWRLLVP